MPDYIFAGLISLAILIYVLGSIHRIKHDAEDSRVALERMLKIAQEIQARPAVKP